MSTYNADQILQERLKWIKDNPSICIWPYNKFDIRIPSHNDNNSKLQVSCCCNLSTPAYIDNLEQDPFLDLKEKLSKGYLPPECNKCKNEEETGGISERAKTLLNFEIDVLEKFKNTKRTDWFELTIFVSNVCNLSCRSCEPFSSSTYAKITLNSEYEHLSVDITSVDKYWNLITQTIRQKAEEFDVLYVHFMGGEPLLHKGNIKIVNWLVENDLHKKIQIRITTSLNVPINKQLAEKLNLFSSVEFILSIDGAHENYHYIRWPAKFDKVVQNLNQLVEHTKIAKYPYKFYLCPVISLNNVLYLEEYLDFWYNWKKTHDINLLFMQTNLLPRTSHLDLQALPRVYRHHLVTYLKKLLQHKIIIEYEDFMFQLINFINSALNELESYSDDINLWHNFLVHTAEFDIRTNTNFSHYNKRLYDVLFDEDKILFSQKIKEVNKYKKFTIF